MIVKNFHVEEVVMLRFDYKTNKARLKVITSDSQEPITMDVTLAGNFEELARNLLKKIKEVRTPEDDDKGVLGGIAVVNILNFEDASESMYKSLVRMDNRIERIKNMKVASEYMSAYHQVNEMQETLFKRSFKTRKDL